jgi:hypothetical protein
MGRGLPGSEADYASLHATITIKTEGATKAPGLVVRMGGDAHQAEHGFIVT